VFTVRDHFKVASLDGFGLEGQNRRHRRGGRALHYLTQHLRRDVKHLTRISFYQRSDFLALDYTTLRHLEILEPLHTTRPRNASLYGALNRTVTPMGARRLRNWLSQPLAAVEPIRRGRMPCKRSSKIPLAWTVSAQQLARCAISNAPSAA
jgi:DNA mismatch repair protein MutS